MKRSLYLFATLSGQYLNKKIFSYRDRTYDVPVVLEKKNALSVTLRKNITYTDLLSQQIHFDPLALMVESVTCTSIPNNTSAPYAIVNNELGYICFCQNSKSIDDSASPITLTFSIIPRDIGGSSIAFSCPVKLNAQVA